MKKLILFAYIVGLQLIVFSQVPDGYYDPAEGLSREALKSALYTIIKGHTEYPYSSSSTDTWDILKVSDRDPENAENVILFYTGWSVNAAQEYNNENGWNREHIWAKSRGDFGTSPGPGTDAHHLRPSDITVNYARANRWFDNCVTPYVDGGIETGCFTSVSSWVWQPRAEVKGDVARMIFYMATRYEGESGEPDLEVIDYFPSDDNTQEPVHAKLSTLLEWHLEDSVDSFEQNRNEVIYGYQGNRNPFVDHPEYVDLIWGAGSVTIYDTIFVYDTTFITEVVYDSISVTDTLVIDVVLTEIEVPDNSSTIKVYPNPAKDHLFIHMGDFEKMTRYQLKIIDQLGTTVFETIVEDILYEVNLSDWSGLGLYYIQVIDTDGNILDIRKIILQ